MSFRCNRSSTTNLHFHHDRPRAPQLRAPYAFALYGVRPKPSSVALSPGKEYKKWQARSKHVGKRQEGFQGRRAGEEERRPAAAVEEEAVRPDRGQRVAAAAQATRSSPAAAAATTTATPPQPPPSPPPRGRRGQSQGAPLRQHEDRGLRGAQGQVRLLHRGHVRREGDRLQVPTGRGLERGDHLTDGPVQEPTGHPGGQVYPAEAAATRRACARTEPQDAAELAQRGVTCPASPADIGAPFAVNWTLDVVYRLPPLRHQPLILQDKLRYSIHISTEPF